MAEVFVGAQIRAGQFTDEKTGKLVNYNNLVLYTNSKPISGNDGFGVLANNPVKISNKPEIINRVFGQSINMNWLKARLGKYIAVFYDEFKKPAMVQFFDEDPDAAQEVFPELPSEEVSDKKGKG